MFFGVGGRPMLISPPSRQARSLRRSSADLRSCRKKILVLQRIGRNAPCRLKLDTNCESVPNLLLDSTIQMR